VLAVFEQPDEGAKSFFSEIISSISDVKFSRDGRYIFSRDYLTVKVWDSHMDAGPVATINVHEELRASLCDLYETDCIFDKFECAVSGDGQHVATGTYNNVFQVHDREGRGASHTEVSRNVAKRRMPMSKGIKGAFRRAPADSVGEAIAFDKKILHLAWHPERDVVAIAGLNRLYFYSV
jgi:serine/threonine-protein phosphatase 2A regulatory subunit B